IVLPAKFEKYNIQETFKQRLTLSPNGEYLAVADDNDLIHVYDTNNLHKRVTISEHLCEGRAVEHLTFGPDNKKIAFRSKDRIYIWEYVYIYDFSNNSFEKISLDSVDD